MRKRRERANDWSTLRISSCLCSLRGSQRYCCRDLCNAGFFIFQVDSPERAPTFLAQIIG